MGRESEIAAQRRRRAEKLNSSDPEVVAWQLAVERRKNEQKATRAAETPQQREVRLPKRRRQDAKQRARPPQQQQLAPCISWHSRKPLLIFSCALQLPPHL